MPKYAELAKKKEILCSACRKPIVFSVGGDYESVTVVCDSCHAENSFKKKEVDDL